MTQKQKGTEMLSLYESRKVGIAMIILTIVVCLVSLIPDLKPFDFELHSVFKLTIVTFTIAAILENGIKGNIPLFPIIFIPSVIYVMNEIAKLEIDIWGMPLAVVLFCLSVIAINKGGEYEKYTDNLTLLGLVIYLIYNFGINIWMLFLLSALFIEINFDSKFKKYLVTALGFCGYISLS